MDATFGATDMYTVPVETAELSRVMWRRLL